MDNFIDQLHVYILVIFFFNFYIFGQFAFMTIKEPANQISVLPGHSLSEYIARPG